MTHISIEAQIDAIKEATYKATKTKASAKKFLLDAGIIKQSKICVTKPSLRPEKFL